MEVKKANLKLFVRYSNDFSNHACLCPRMGTFHIHDKITHMFAALIF
jgi:hypothetical protein